MENIRDYSKDKVEAAKRALVELAQALGEYRENFVLVGGWVPYFLVNHNHVGSTDIDIVLDKEEITNDCYQTIVKYLEKLGYKPDKDQPFIFYKEILIEGEQLIIELDLLAGVYGGTGKQHRTQNIQNIKARKTRGAELALKYYNKIKIWGKMPDGAENEVELKISSVAPFLIMKAMALNNRQKYKDAYDIYFCIKYFPGGMDSLANEFKLLSQSSLAKQAIEIIKDKFASVNSIGPIWVAQFEDTEEIDAIKRDAYEQLIAFLKKLQM